MDDKRRLPYDGDLQAAVRAQDREAVRALMSARDIAAATVESVEAIQRSEDAAGPDTLCPICHEHLHKPCVNECGHTFCFWCLHQAMDGIGRSACPLCRSPFLHLPAPCFCCPCSYSCPCVMQPDPTK